jgi:hypothetical protein
VPDDEATFPEVAGPFVSSGDTDQKHTYSRSPVWFDLENFIRLIPCRMNLGLVYLTWIELCFASGPKAVRRPMAHCQDQHKTDVYLSIRCQFVRLDG